MLSVFSDNWYYWHVRDNCRCVWDIGLGNFSRWGLKSRLWMDNFDSSPLTKKARKKFLNSFPLLINRVLCLLDKRQISGACVKPFFMGKKSKQQWRCVNAWGVADSSDMEKKVHNNWFKTCKKSNTESVEEGHKTHGSYML